MERPTKEQVDEMLAEYVHRECECHHHTPRLDAHSLADEVRALREEREWCGTNHGNNMCPVGLQKVRELQAENAKLRADLETVKHDRTDWAILAGQRAATIARVEALPAKWRQEELTRHDSWHDAHSGDTCADELDAALKGSD
jgi:hypothetical protein